MAVNCPATARTHCSSNVVGWSTASGFKLMSAVEKTSSSDFHQLCYK